MALYPNDLGIPPSNSLHRFMKTILLTSILCFWAANAMTQPVDVLPVRLSDGAQSLNGEWPFKYIASSELGPDTAFFQPGFDVSTWNKLPVPGHWDLHGYTPPQYNDDVKEGTGLYRRTFRVAKGWQGERVFLRFDGVLYGFTAYVNGKPVGEWASSFNASTFDITDALLPGDVENVLAVQVSTRSRGWNFDNMDCWALSGIFRDVTLFALPQLHLKDYTARTTLHADGSAALQLEIVASAASNVTGRLIAADGKSVRDFALDLPADGRGTAQLQVTSPQLWTAETPHLYTLELELVSGGQTVQKYTDRIGLRQVTIEDGVLKLNGSPIKLRGVNHHDIWPEGRVATEDAMRRDLQLIREANINFVRTSHYPPHPRLLELCDEMGFYVDDEVPYVHGRKHLKDPDFQQDLHTRARATVMRDKNRPSVIFWSLGNENPVTELGNNTGKYVKELDPTRPFTFPTIGSQFEGYMAKFPESMELYAPHYPSAKTARKLAATVQKPMVFTEYAHQRGLARGGTGVQGLWEIFYKSPRIAGGAVWVFQDQGLLRTAAENEEVKDGDLMAWLDDRRYYDTRGFYAMDGLVYSDRTPQVDYWQVRKVYSPVQIPERELTLKPGAQKLDVHVENRFDFRTLSGIQMKWALRQNGASIQDGTISLATKAKETATVPLPLTPPDPLGTAVYTLDIQFEDETGRQIYERSLRLKPADPVDRWDLLKKEQKTAEATLEVTDSSILVQHPAIQLKVDRKTGGVWLLDPKGVVLADAMGPHMGRNPTINDMAKNREREPDLWRWSLLREVQELQTDARKLPEGIEVTVSGVYPRPNKPEESVRGAYKLLVTPSGTAEVSYDYAPQQGTGEVLEAGFALSVPAAQSEIRWLGEGPYAGYPGKDRLNEFGAFHLNREDLYAPGNRRGVEFASLASPTGSGLVLGGAAGMTVDLEVGREATVLAHLAIVPGDRSTNEEGENVDVSSRINAASIKQIRGGFKLLPVGRTWPKTLTGWLGSPDARADVMKPFVRSYDR